MSEKKTSKKGGKGAKKKLYVVANAHLDTQWNWTIQDTIRDSVKNTLLQNFELFEKYPHYRMNFEGAFRYKLAKEYYPDLYEKLKGYVAEGRWNVAGSQWDASDANVPSSEAYMRQILLGNGFFEQEFGKKSSDIFLTDCFGFRYSLPSIAAHMGLNGFSTQKLVWGVGSPIYREDGSVSRPMPEKGVPRMDLGKWVGPDGNYVIGSLLGGNYTHHFEWDPEKRPIHDRPEYLADIEHNEKYAGVAARMMYYGVGDYGGSPSDESARYLNEAVAANGEDKAFDVIAGSTDDIFNDLTPEQIAALPEYRGNLLIPHGYGAMTSHTINKRWNRKCELLADACERAAIMAKWLGRAAYPKKRLDDAWKLFLWHQFHDDLPGTSILAAYQFTHNDFVIAQNMMAEELTASADSVASALATDVEGDPVVVYNPTGFYRTDVVVAPLPKGSAHAKVYTASGEEVPSQIARVNGEKVVKFAATVAPVSFTVFSVAASDESCALDTGLKVSLGRLENERYRVTLNYDGNIASIYDKKFDRELLSAPSSLATREDNNTNWPSWEIKYEDTKLPFTDVGGVRSIEIVDNGPAIVSLKVVRKEKGSEYVQTISLVAGGNRVNVDNEVDWHCRRTLLSAGFPLTVSNPVATFDLGLGAEEGGNTDSFPYFQHNVHQWADLTDSDGSFGVAILNDCKYGMEKPDDHTLRLTLIHTPLGAFMSQSAQDWQDHGRNIFRYGFTSHAGVRDGVAAEASCLNTPLYAFTTAKHPGKSSEYSFVSTNNDEIAIRAVKQEEKGNRLIVRVQETSGRDQKGVGLTFAASIEKAVETNGYEEGNGCVNFTAHTLAFDMTPYSVKTFALDIIDDEPLSSDRGTPIALDYNKRVTTPRSDLTSGEFGQGISIPEELFEKNVSCGGTDFVLGDPGRYNAVMCYGQTVKAPAGAKKVAVLAASTHHDIDAAFKVGKKKVVIRVQDFSTNVGTWDQIASGDQASIRRDPVAVSYSHTHDQHGDRLYKFANIFKYVIDLGDADEITLPDDYHIIVMAMTAVSGGNTRETAPIYDTAKVNDKPTHKLTVIGADGSGKYREGANVLISAQKYNGNGIFERFEGDADIVWKDKDYAMIEMGTRDAVVRPIYSNLGENVVLGKPCKESDMTNESEQGNRALNGQSVNKWCAPVNDDGEAWLEVDIGKVTPIYKWLVLHCGDSESERWNTSDFRLEYKLDPDDEWKIADSVTDNKDTLTIREFAPVNARYVRLFITKCAQGRRERHCRIYQLHVYKYQG